MPDKLSDIRYQLALANRILANEGVIDAFGHVSARHPDDPNIYLLSRSRSPELVEPDDILEYTLDSQLAKPSDLPLYSERVIHGEIYKARPDVMAVAHHHSPNFMPLVITGTDYVPVFHLGAVGGSKPPFWDQNDEFGDTNLLVVKPEEGASLARALGQHWLVLMNRHGVTAVGLTLRECVFRCVFSHLNAKYQVEAARSGTIDPLSPGEVKEAFGLSTKTTGQARSWEYWTVRLDKAGGTPPGGAGARQGGKAARRRRVARRRARRRRR